jgi:hypothetical protein
MLGGGVAAMIDVRRVKCFGGLAFLVVFLAGCSKGDGGKAKLAPVRGRVLFDNKAVTAADIFFLPDTAKGNQGMMASSVLQEDGSFTLTTQPDGEGAVPGTYKVTLSLGRRPEKVLDKYRRIETTPLQYTVPPEGLTDLVIELK